MDGRRKLQGIVALTVLAVVLLFQLHVGAVSAQSSVPGNGPTLEDLQTRLKHAQSETELEPALKQQVVEAYQSAIERFEIATEASANAKKHLDRLDSVGTELAQTRLKLEQLPEQPVLTIASDDDIGALQRTLEERRKQIDEPTHGLQARVDHSKKKLASQKSRLEQIAKDLAEVDERLASIQEQMDAPVPEDQPRELTNALRTLLRIRKKRATEERNALSAEQTWCGSEAVAELLRAQRDLAGKELALADAEAQLLQDAVDKRRGSEADQRVAAAEQVVSRTSTRVKPVAAVNLLLARESHDLAASLHETNRRVDTTREALNAIKAEFKQSKTMVEAVGLTESIGLLLRQQRAKLSDTHGLQSRLALRGETVRQTRLRLFQIEADLAALQDLDTAAIKSANELDSDESIAAPNTAVAPEKSGAPPADALLANDEIKGLLEQRRDLLEQLNSDYSIQFEKMVLLDNDERKLLEETHHYADFIDERVLWIRTGTVFGGSQIVRAVGGANWIFDRANWYRVVDAYQVNCGREPIPYAIALAGLIFWVCGRWPLRRRLQNLGMTATNESCRDIVPTIQAMGLTLFFGSILPITLRFLGWRLDHCASTLKFVHAVGTGLVHASTFAVPLEILRVVVVRGGLAEKHFEWSKETLVRLRRHLYWFLPVGIALTCVVGMIEASSDEQRLDSLGRSAYLIFTGLLAFYCYRAFPRLQAEFATAPNPVRPPQDSRRSTNTTSEDDVWMNRLIRVGRFLAVAIPLGLVFLCWTGYFYTALQLTWRLQASAWLALGLILLREFVQRWLKLERRRMAVLQEQELQAIEGASRQPGSDGQSPFLFPRWTWPDFRLNLSQIVTQVRSLLDTGLLTLAAIGLWVVWADVTPALNILDRVTLWHTTVEEVEEVAPAKGADGKPTVHMVQRPRDVTAADLGLAILLMSIAAVASRNIPGLVEVVLLEHLSVDAGIRFATTCLVRYAIFTTGVVVAFNQIGIGWNSVQWLVAAASVGLGFGLQEIFANFVSGIILLFERPMRVGDVITIGDTTGTVSRIRFRATTIVDGDRKELIVPNKSFITGNLLNWTLSDSINRVAIKVGVAYGSDPNRVRELLLKIAFDHPALLKDPAPFAILEELGDSALIFQLRAFLPNLKDRGRVTHELNSMIHDRFRTAGIDIPFPQQEVSLNVRSQSPPKAEPNTNLHGSLEEALKRAGVRI